MRIILEEFFQNFLYGDIREKLHYLKNTIKPDNSEIPYVLANLSHHIAKSSAILHHMMDYLVDVYIEEYLIRVIQYTKIYNFERHLIIRGAYLHRGNAQKLIIESGIRPRNDLDICNINLYQHCDPTPLILSITDEKIRAQILGSYLSNIDFCNKINKNKLPKRHITKESRKRIVMTMYPELNEAFQFLNGRLIKEISVLICNYYSSFRLKDIVEAFKIDKEIENIFICNRFD